MVNICVGFPRSGTHWVGNIIKHFYKDTFLQLHEVWRSNLKYNKAVYIKRNPAGIIESSMRTFNLSNENLNILDRWNVGSWNDHVNSWKEKPNVLYINYEDLLKNSIKEFTKILNWFDIEFNIDELKNILEYYSVNNIKNRNEEPSPKGSWNGNNNWKNILSDDFKIKIKKKYGSKY